MKNCKIIVLLLIPGIILWNSCKKKGGPPVLEFLKTSKYTWQNDTINVGDSVKVGLKCTWNGIDKLSDLNIFLDNNLEKKLELDTTNGEGMTVQYKIEKRAGISEENWTFELVDVKDQKSSLSLRIVQKESTKTN